MPVKLKVNVHNKIEPRNTEFHVYEYDLKNSEGKKFHVKVQREIIKKPVIAEH